MGSDVKEFLQTAADRNGFSRDRFEERRVPSDVANITVMPFFGDLRSAFVLSSILLKRFREEVKGSKYFILCGWPGFQALFPYVDEYWSITDEAQARRMVLQTDGFYNRAEVAAVYFRNLNELFFRDVVDVRDLSEFYNNGITEQFWERFRHVKRTLPMVPSLTVLGKEFNRELATRAGYRVLLHPSLAVNSWREGRPRPQPARREFWAELVRRLLRDGFVPVLWRNSTSHDLSGDFPSECVHVHENDVGRALGMMRAVGCVLDVFTGSSRLAIAARCPFLACDERARFSAVKEYEVDDLCGAGVPRQYIFSFSTIIEGGGPSEWNTNLFNGVVGRLKAFLPELDRDAWPATSESTEIVPYERVRKQAVRRLGVRLLKVPTD